MLDLLRTIVDYIIQGINTILTIITSIPTYFGMLLSYINEFTPSFLLPFIAVGFTACVVICIKRLVL